jgi:chorismate synthase
MSINRFGHLLTMATWGESHGPAIGAVVDGCPPGLELDEAWVQQWLDRRRPGTSPAVSARQEPDRVRILSGVFEGKTTGTPISLMIDNVDARPGDYEGLPHRAGHADFAYEAKYGLRDPRGGGRASARETAARVAAGAIARRVVPDVTIEARLIGMGGESDPGRWEAMIEQAKADGDSLGGIVECVATGVPAGWGAPIYAKLDAELAAACMGINGGIATGKPIVLRAAFKPTSSIGIGGRHDPCVAIRGAPVVEAMVALVLADHKLLHRAQSG